MSSNVPLRKIVASNLSQLRKEKGLTQIQLAELFNYSDKAVSKWERGDTLPDLETLKALADYYGVTLDYLVHDGTEKQQYLIKKEKVNKKAVARISCMIPLLLSVAIYIILHFALNINYWMAFLWWIPVDFLLLFIFAWLWWDKNKRSIYGICFSWTACICTYLELGCDLPDNTGWQVWEVLLIAIPLTIALLWWRKIKVASNKQSKD